MTEIDSHQTGPAPARVARPTAVVCTALGLEYEAVFAHLVEPRTELEERGALYEVARFTGPHATWRVAVTQTGPGDVPASAQVERAIQVFSPDVVLFVGVAGGRRDVALGDVVAANAIYGYEAGESSERGFVSRIKTYQPSFRLVQRAQRVAVQHRWPERVLPPRNTPVPTAVVASAPAGNPPERTPSAFVKPLAAGGKVVTHRRSQVARLLDRHCDDVLAVEMEGYGFLQAAYLNPSVDALVVRGISDLLTGKDTRTDQHWQPVAASNAAAFAFEVLSSLIPTAR